MKLVENQIIEISAPGDRALGAAIWQLLDRGFVVTLTPAKKGARSGGFTVEAAHRSARYRKINDVTVELLTQASPKARRVNDCAPGTPAQSVKRNSRGRA